MSWLFSQALVAEYSVGTCSAGEPCAQLNAMPTPHPFWRNDKTTAFSSPFRFGLTCAVLTADRGAELLTLYLEDFRAKTSARPERAQASTAPVLASGVKWRELSARYDRDTFSWRTHQTLFAEDLASSSVTFPKWGMTVDGVLWERITWALRMSESALGLREMWPTPTAHNAKQGAHPSEFNRNTPTLAAQVGGKLNPTWVEWLMGWPLGWTDLRPLATDRFQRWLRSHGGS